jgi:hypothetical protein
MYTGAAAFISQAFMWLTENLFWCYFVSGGYIRRFNVLWIMSLLYRNMGKWKNNYLYMQLFIMKIRDQHYSQVTEKHKTRRYL